MTTELAARESDGLRVRLLWKPEDGTVVVTVDDLSSGGGFELNVRPESALDAFHHPFAYATDQLNARLVDHCVRCGESPAIDESALCGHCHWKLGEERRAA
jgi:hypothetical protein